MASPPEDTVELLSKLFTRMTGMSSLQAVSSCYKDNFS